ncbi:MAG: hypothetical protein K0R66_825 [Gammaproteobacteria bacterium]|jgi:hypothetical protein|nr:hypothetical protein [Gammaproteobacteria bacterium]
MVNLLIYNNILQDGLDKYSKKTLTIPRFFSFAHKLIHSFVENLPTRAICG